MGLNQIIRTMRNHTMAPWFSHKHVPTPSIYGIMSHEYIWSLLIHNDPQIQYLDAPKAINLSNLLDGGLPNWNGIKQVQNNAQCTLRFSQHYMFGHQVCKVELFFDSGGSPKGISQEPPGQWWPWPNEVWSPATTRPCGTARPRKAVQTQGEGRVVGEYHSYLLECMILW